MTPHIFTDAEINSILDEREATRGGGSGYGRRSNDGEGGKWPSWTQAGLQVLAFIAAIILAYSALDKRIALIEQALNDQRQKLDLIIYQQSGKR